MTRGLAPRRGNTSLHASRASGFDATGEKRLERFGRDSRLSLRNKLFYLKHLRCLLVGRPVALAFSQKVRRPNRLFSIADRTGNGDGPWIS
jgi:hypothetical protein